MTCCCGSHAANCSGPAGSSGSAAPELDDLAYQAAADALLAIVAKLGQFRGERKSRPGATSSLSSKYRPKSDGILEQPGCADGCRRLERLPGRFGADPAQETERRELAGAVRRAVDENLTPRQRKVFVAIVLDGVPMDALVTELGSARNAIYKTMFDARRKLRGSLAAGGYLDDQTSGHS